MRVALWSLAALPLLAAEWAAEAQKRPTEQEIACQLDASECAYGAAGGDDGSMVISDGQRPICLPGMACTRQAAVSGAPAATANTRRLRRPAYVGGGRSAPTQVFRQPKGKADMALTFANGSAELSSDARNRVETFARVLTSRPALASASYRIEGHTNSVGARDSNLELSRRRAQAVVDYLGSLGVPRDRLEAAGLGFDAPLPGVARANAANRRVEIIKK